MKSTRMRADQDTDDYSYHMDSCQDRLNACDPPKGPMGWQYEDIMLEILPSEYGRIVRLISRREALALPTSPV